MLNAIGILSDAAVPGARHDAEFLLASLLGTDRGGLYVRRRETLDPEIAARYETWIERRRQREPLQHLTGEQEFCGHRFKADLRALIPRPETELLVASALEQVLPRGARVIDLGTGSGCIAISLLLARQDLVIGALDNSGPALALARENAAIHGVLERIAFVRADLSVPPSSWVARSDLVISNPPYVREGEWDGLQQEVRDYDPKTALVAGPTGLEVFEALIPRAWSLLRAGGRLLLEIGFGQFEAVVDLASSQGFERISVREDLQGIPRVLSGFRPIL